MLYIFGDFKIFSDVNVVDGDGHVEHEASFGQKFVKLFSRLVEDFSDVVDLDEQDPDVDLVPGNGLQDLRKTIDRKVVLEQPLLIQRRLVS